MNIQIKPNQKLYLLSALEGAALAWFLKEPITGFVLSGKSFSGRSILFQFVIYTIIFCSCSLIFLGINFFLDKKQKNIEEVQFRLKLYSINENATLLLLGVIGIILRIRQYTFDRSLWFDELSLAHNFLNHDLQFLISNPLDTRQSAPLGFVVIAKIIGEVFNYSDLSLRSFPFLIGIGVVVLSIFVSKSFSTPLSRYLFVGLISTSPLLVYYSNEFKPYVIDVFFYLLLLLVFIYYHEKKISIVVVTFVGILAIIFSYSAVIVLSAFGIISFLIASVNNCKKDQKKIVIASIVWSVLFAVIYLGFSIRNSPMDYYHNYWSIRFAPISISLESFRWYWNAILEFGNIGFHPQKPIGVQFYSGLAEPFNVILALITCLGIFFQIKYHKKVALFNIGILVISIIISAFRLYPFGSRLNLYLIPIAFSTLIYCLERMVQNSAFTIRFLGYLLIVFTLALSTISSVNTFINPIDNADIKNALVYLQKKAVLTDTLTMVDNTYPAYSFYKKYYNLPNFYQTSFFPRPFDENKYLIQLCNNHASNHVWILITQLFHESKGFISELSEKGRLLDKWESSGSGLYYFQFDLKQICQENNQ